MKKKNMIDSGSNKSWISKKLAGELDLEGKEIEVEIFYKGRIKSNKRQLYIYERKIAKITPQ